MLPSQMEDNTKTSDKQNLHDFLQETLAWINFNYFRRRKLISNNKELPLFCQKICCFQENCGILSYYTKFLSEKWEGQKKMKHEMDDH